MEMFLKTLFFTTTTVVLILSNLVIAATRIDITRGNMEPTPIAINELGGAGREATAIGRKIAKIITQDLERSGLFKKIDKSAYIQHLDHSTIVPDFSLWRQINASVILAGNVNIQLNEQLEVAVRLWDPYAEKELTAKAHITSKDNWRIVSHKIADEIYHRLTGETGYFNTKIAYIAESGPATMRTKKLAIIDQDGANLRYITTGNHLVLTPRFSPDSRKIIYLSYAKGVPRVFLRDLFTGREHIVGDFPGMTFAPRFSPDGNKAAMSVARDGNSDIYIIDLKNLKKKRLTKGAYIDTSPYYSPNGKRVAFSSDRSGRLQIYTMNVDGSNQKRISYGNGSYHTPAWSPRGDFIAFTKIHRGQFHIGVIRPDGSGERILTQGYLVEGPSWSPNGRVIMFTRGERNIGNKLGKSTLRSIDLTGYHERQLSVPTDASDPTWSPPLD
jgi:TolB protein